MTVLFSTRCCVVILFYLMNSSPVPKRIVFDYNCLFWIYSFIESIIGSVRGNLGGTIKIRYVVLS